MSEIADHNQCRKCGKLWPHPKAGIFAPCWNCMEARDQKGDPLHMTWPGCKQCVTVETSELICERCGVWVMPQGLWWHGNLLPKVEFDRYPAAWRLEFYAIHGAEEPAMLPTIRAHLRARYSDRSLTRLEMVNQARVKMGLMPIAEDENGEAIL